MIKSLIEQHQKCIAILEAIQWENKQAGRIADDIAIWNRYGSLAELAAKWQAEIDFKSRVIIKLWKYYKREVSKCQMN